LSSTRDDVADHPGVRYRSYSMLSGKLSTSGRLVSANGCWPQGTGILRAPGRLGKFAGDVEIALRDEHLVGGR
jgi:hypothetical protein